MFYFISLYTFAIYTHLHFILLCFSRINLKLDESSFEKNIVGKIFFFLFCSCRTIILFPVSFIKLFFACYIIRLRCISPCFNLLARTLHKNITNCKKEKYFKPSSSTENYLFAPDFLAFLNN